MIRIDSLRKVFKSTVAVNEVTLDIAPGKIIGILGPNGAGKSTTIKSIVGGVVPTSGSIVVNGKSPTKDRSLLSGSIGYMPQSAALYLDLSALENVIFFAQLHGVKQARSKAQNLLKLLGLSDKQHLKVQGFSGGMKTRVSLACTLIHSPQIIILDEPTAGLDPALKRKLWQMFNDFASEGKAVIISTHLMEEAVLCHELIVISEGRVVTQGAPQELIDQGQTHVALTYNNGSIVNDSIPNSTQSLAKYLHKHGLKQSIFNASIKHEGLEDILIKLTKAN